MANGFVDSDPSGTIIIEIRHRNLWVLAKLLHKAILEAKDAHTVAGARELLSELSEQTDTIYIDVKKHLSAVEILEATPKMYSGAK